MPSQGTGLGADGDPQARAFPGNSPEGERVKSERQVTAQCHQGQERPSLISDIAVETRKEAWGPVTFLQPSPFPCCVLFLYGPESGHPHEAGRGAGRPGTVRGKETPGRKEVTGRAGERLRQKANGHQKQIHDQRRYC